MAREITQRKVGHKGARTSSPSRKGDDAEKSHRWGAEVLNQGPLVVLGLAALVGLGTLAHVFWPKPPPPPCKVLIEVKESSIPGAGLGIFLAKDAEPLGPKTVVTLYGGRIMRTNETEGKPDLENYAIFVPNLHGWSRVGGPWTGEVPSTVCGPEEPVGHLINDGATVVLEPGSAATLGMKGLDEKVQEYKRLSKERQNVAFAPDSQVTWKMRTTKAISPGEELFMPYQEYYWLSTTYKTSTDPALRLLTYFYTSKNYANQFPGDRLILDADWNLRLSRGNWEVDEAVCRVFITAVLGVGGDDEAVQLAYEIGMPTDEEGNLQWSYTGLLRHMIDVTFQVDRAEEA